MFTVMGSAPHTITPFASAGSSTPAERSADATPHAPIVKLRRRTGNALSHTERAK